MCCTSLGATARAAGTDPEGKPHASLSTSTSNIFLTPCVSILSWRVLRSQKEEEAKVEPPPEPIPVPPPPPPSAGASDWGAGGGWGDEGEDGEWGAEEEVDLEALLKVRDEGLTTLQAPIGKRQPAGGKGRGEAGAGGAAAEGGEVVERPVEPVELGGPAFPAFEVIDRDEPTASTGGGGSGEYSDEAIRARLSKYWEEEEDRDLVALLQRCSSGGAEEERVRATATQGSGGCDPEAYESATPAAKAFFRFQVRSNALSGTNKQ